MPPAVTGLQQAGLSPVHLLEQQYNLPDSLSPSASPQSSPKPIGTQSVLQGLLPQPFLSGLPLTFEDGVLAPVCQLPSPDDLPVQFEQPKPEQVMHSGSIEYLQPWQQRWQQQWQGLQQHSSEHYGHLRAQCWEFKRISDSSSHSSSGSAQTSNQVRGWPSQPSSGGINTARAHQVERYSGLVASAPVFMPYSTLAGGITSRSIGGTSSACVSFGSSGCAVRPRSSSTCSSASTVWAGMRPASTASYCSSFTDNGHGWSTDTANSFWSAAPFSRGRSKSCGTNSCHIDCAATADSRVVSAQVDSAATAHRRQRGSHSRHSYEAQSRPEAEQPCSTTSNSSRASSSSSTPAGHPRHSEQLAALDKMPQSLLVVALEQRHAPTCGSRQLLVQRLAALLEQEQETVAAAASMVLEAAAPPTTHAPEATAWPAAEPHARSSSSRTTDLESSSTDPPCAQTAASLSRLVTPAAAAAANLRVPWVEFEHEGVRYRFKRNNPVCSRCGCGGHGVWQCSLKYCDSCKAHGHAEGPACATACNRCGRHHGDAQQCKVRQCSKCKLFGHHVHHCPSMQCRLCGWYGHATQLCWPVFAEEAAEQSSQQSANETITATTQDGGVRMAGVQSGQQQLLHAAVVDAQGQQAVHQAQSNTAASCCQL